MSPDTLKLHKSLNLPDSLWVLSIGLLRSIKNNSILFENSFCIFCGSFLNCLSNLFVVVILIHYEVRCFIKSSAVLKGPEVFPARYSLRASTTNSSK